MSQTQVGKEEARKKEKRLKERRREYFIVMPRVEFSGTA
jgi:hypothetical protein